MKKMNLFVTVEGHDEDKLVEVDPHGHVKDIVESAIHAGLPVHTESAHVFLEEGDEPIALSENIEKAGIKADARIHINRCRKIRVTVHYGRQDVDRSFAPSVTVGTVQKWAAEKLLSNEIDRKEHVLQVCQSDLQPTPRTQIGTLVKHQRHEEHKKHEEHEKCELCFDLVAAVRVEG